MKDGMFREAILSELRRCNLTVYGLSEKQSGVHASTVKQFLYSGTDPRASTLETLIKQLGMELVSGEELRELRNLANTVKRLRRRPPSVERAMKQMRCLGASA